MPISPTGFDGRPMFQADPTGVQSSLTPKLLYGTAAARPTAGPHNYGSFYLATDTNGGTLYLSTFTAGSGFSWVQTSSPVTAAAGLVYNGTTANDSFNNTASETAFSKSYTIPSGTLVVGDSIRVRLFGAYSTTGTPTLQIRFKAGGTTVIDTGAITMPSGVGNQLWSMDISGLVTVIGASGAVNWNAVGAFESSATTAIPINILHKLASPSTDPSLDTTTTAALTVTGQWGTANVSNVVELDQMKVWIEHVGSI